MRTGVWYSALAAFLFATSAAAQDQRYTKPRFGDARLDWCLEFGKDCGRPAAEAFCKRRRFTGARIFEADRVGTREPTRTIGTNQVCKGQTFCTAFAYVTCFGPIGIDRVFANPEWKGYRLDVCWRWANNCGKPAADAFCRAKGFREAFQYTTDAGRGYSPTRLIGTDQICRDGCTGFQQIICQ